MADKQTTTEPSPILIVGLDGRKVTLQMIFRANSVAGQQYDDLIADCRRGIPALNMSVKPHD
jgi:hypothetical protein